MRIAIVGNLNIDISTSPIQSATNLLSDGETSVERIEESVGGGGAFTALAAAKMGANVSFCASIGNDIAGQRLTQSLHNAKIQTHLAIKPALTGKSIALNLANGHRHFLSSLPSAALLELADINLDALCGSNCQHLYRADIWFAPSMLAEGNFQLLQQAKSRGIQTSIDINWDPHWSAGPNNAEVRQRIEQLRRLLPFVDYVHGNQRELCIFAGCDDLSSSAKWFFASGASTLIVHRGSEGGIGLLSDGQQIEAPALKVDKSVRVAGAGDVFTAAFLNCESADLRSKLQAANRAAADHCRGAVDYFPPLS